MVDCMYFLLMQSRTVTQLTRDSYVQFILVRQLSLWQNKFDRSVSVTEEHSCSQESTRVQVLEWHCECSPENYRVIVPTSASTYVELELASWTLHVDCTVPLKSSYIASYVPT